MHIADSDDLDLLRDGDAGFKDGFDGAGSGGIVVTEDGVRTGIQREQTASCMISAGIIGGMLDVRSRDRDPCRREGVVVSLLSSNAGSEGRAGDVGDAAAS